MEVIPQGKLKAAFGTFQYTGGVFWRLLVSTHSRKLRLRTTIGEHFGERRLQLDFSTRCQTTKKQSAYAYVPVNGLKAQQRLVELLEGKLIFAGEATSVGHIGTVHGAFQSGQRAARELLG